MFLFVLQQWLLVHRWFACMVSFLVFSPLRFDKVDGFLSSHWMSLFELQQLYLVSLSVCVHEVLCGFFCSSLLFTKLGGFTSATTVTLLCVWSAVKLIQFLLIRPFTRLLVFLLQLLSCLFLPFSCYLCLSLSLCLSLFLSLTLPVSFSWTLIVNFVLNSLSV